MKRPSVIWISGAPDQGKTTFCQLLTKDDVISTDSIISNTDWSDCPVVLKAWKNRTGIGKFLDWCVNHGKVTYISEKIVSQFSPDKEITFILLRRENPYQF